MITLGHLESKLTAAEEPSHELDGDIELALGIYVPDRSVSRGKGLYADRWYRPGNVYAVHEARHYTSDLNAIAELITDVKPDFTWSLEQQSGTMYRAEIRCDGVVLAFCYDCSPALAICIAFARACRNSPKKVALTAHEIAFHLRVILTQYKPDRLNEYLNLSTEGQKTVRARDEGRADVCNAIESLLAKIT